MVDDPVPPGVRAYRLAYDGRPYHGFQRQPDVQTVEDSLFEALRALDVLGPAGPPEGYAAAGRTDAGVSAVAQTVAFEGPAWLTPAALNAELPASVRAWALAGVPEDFHATHDATERTYTYHLHAPGADVERARAALGALSGTHDFHNLTPDDEGTVRTVEGDLVRDGDYLVLRFRAGGFARQLVRRLVTVVREVATGAASLDRVDRALATDPLPGHEGVAPAPASPLVLSRVTYPGTTFEVDPEAADSARSVFAAERDRRATAARVAADLASLGGDG